MTDHIRAILLRQMEAYQTIALCASWLAEEERAAAQASADEANRRTAALARWRDGLRRNEAMLDLTKQEDVPWTHDPHTPTPWSDFAESGDWWIQGKDTDGNPIGLPVCDANSMSAADMFFILQAVNAHEALVEQLQQAQEDVCSLHCPSVWKTADGRPPHSARCQSITAALAKARGSV